MSPGGPDEPAEGLIEGILEADDQATATSPGAESELLTFLFADIRGYTKFTQQRGDEAAAKLTGKFAMVVRDLVGQYAGTVLELRGDEALCLFSSPRQSLRLAVTLQQRFVEETIDEPELPMTVGIGVDAGEAVRGEDGYRGGALNLAARLCSQAKAGEVLASREVTHLARTIDGIRYEAHDSLVLKGLSEPVRPVRVLPEGEDPAQQINALLAAATPAPAGEVAVWWLPGPLARLSRTGLAAAVAVVALLLAAIAIRVGFSGGSSLSALDENSAGTIDPGSGHLATNLPVDANPTAATEGFGSIWTANTGANTVSQIDEGSNQVSRIGVGSAPSAIAAGADAVWVTNAGSGTVTRIDPTDGSTQTIQVGTAPAGVTVAGGFVWVTNSADGTVGRIDPAEGQVVQTIPVGDSPSGIGASARDIWVANAGSNTVSKVPFAKAGAVNPADVQTIHVGTDPKGVAVIGDSVWVTNNLDGTAARIPVDGTTVSDTVRVGGQPTQIAGLSGHVWVATQAPSTVVEIDPATPRVVRRVGIGAIPGGLAAADNKLWVGATVNPELHSGGTIRIVGQDLGGIDPAYLASPWTGWLLGGSYDGLVGYRHAAGADGTAIVPDLATTIPEPTNGGRTYTFQLRSGIRWSTGHRLTVLDVRRGLERSIANGFSSLQTQIVGARGCTPKHCAVRGIAVDPAANTVTITLVRPNAEFLSSLAISGAAAPADTPLAVQKTKPIPATGPYQVARYVPGKLVVLTRNRYFHQWSSAAQPAGFPNQIEWRVSKAGNEAGVRAVDAGRAEWADARGTTPLPALQARFGKQLYVTPTETTHGVVLNTRMAPFNDERVRRALAYAIDREAVAADWFTNATVTCQALPPNYPGHRPYCPYTLRPDSAGVYHGPDVATALSIMKHHHVSGSDVAVWTPPEMVPGLRHVITALRQLGFHAHVQVFGDPNGDYFGHTADSRNHVQAAFFGWVADNVAARDFFEPLFQCTGFTPGDPGNLNPAEFCSHSVDRLMQRADRAQLSSQVAGNDVWAQVDRRIVDAAPWIPLVNPSWVDVVSPKVHNYVRSPVLGVFFDQMWVR
jgi:peptide/nickel transport system substrate-binding protein